MYELKSIDACGDEYSAREFKTLASARKFVKNFFEDVEVPISVGVWEQLRMRDGQRSYTIKIEKKK